MKKISLWAKSHPWPARIIIVVSFILLNGLGIVTGLLLRDLQVILPSATLLFFVSLYAGGVLFYPRKKNGGHGQARSLFYRRQKTCDLLLVGSTFLMIVYLGNHPRQIFNYPSPFSSAMASTSSLPKDSLNHAYKSGRDFMATVRDEKGKLLKWKERKKLLKTQIKAIRHDDDLSPGAKAALIILCVLVALGLSYLVASLACSLSCSGSEAGAVVVAIGGSALIIFLTIIAIRAIMGKKKKQIKNPETGSPGS